jgi:gluconokinase
MPQQYIIGIDIGTGSTKAVALNNSGHVLATAQFYYADIQTEPGFSEQDPELIWLAFTNTITTITTRLDEPPACISLSSCMHSLLVLNKEDQPLTSLITWADTRSASIAERIRQSTEAEYIYSTTGTPIHSMSPLCKIIWLRENAPLIFQNASRFISIKEYIWHRLFNTFEIDFSIASATGLFDIHNGVWSDNALALAGITPAQLSHPVPANFTRNHRSNLSDELLNIPSSTTFCIGASDGCLANVGAYALENGVAAVTVGTSGAVRIASSKPLLNIRFMTFSYVLDDSLFICGAPISNGGNVLQWLQQNFLTNSHLDYTELFQKITGVTAGSEGLICLPYLHGERAPIWDEKASGVFFGVQPQHTKAHFLRAALEGVCYSLKSIIDILESEGVSIKQLNVSGGFTHSTTWMQMLSDITGKELCLVQTEDASTTGAALVGMKAINMITDLTSLKPEGEIVVEPNFSHTDTYHSYYQVYKTLYETLKQSMHQLYHIKH